jgi:hypothetical protein
MREFTPLFSFTFSVCVAALKVGLPSFTGVTENTTGMSNVLTESVTCTMSVYDVVPPSQSNAVQKLQRDE